MGKAGTRFALVWRHSGSFLSKLSWVVVVNNVVHKQIFSNRLVDTSHIMFLKSLTTTVQIKTNNDASIEKTKNVFFFLLRKNHLTEIITGGLGGMKSLGPAVLLKTPINSAKEGI